MSRRPDWIPDRTAISQAVRTTAWERADGRCEACGEPVEPGGFEYDHITPQALGGCNTPENTQILCLPCHWKKTATDIADIAKADRRGGRSGQYARRKKTGSRLKSRGFQTNRDGKFKKRMDGTVERRE